MAEGFLRDLASDRFEVASAGTEATRVHPLAIRAMRDVGIDISRHHSKTINALLGDPWDYVITVCDSANERCPCSQDARPGSTGASTTRPGRPGATTPGVLIRFLVSCRVVPPPAGVQDQLAMAESGCAWVACGVKFCRDLHRAALELSNT
jgi:hypothetical protein